jgi:hypothetical protein
LAITKKIHKIFEAREFLWLLLWGARGVPAEDFHLDKAINKFCKPMVKGRNVEDILSLMKGNGSFTI